MGSDLGLFLDENFANKVFNYLFDNKRNAFSFNFRLTGDIREKLFYYDRIFEGHSYDVIIVGFLKEKKRQFLGRYFDLRRQEIIAITSKEWDGIEPELKYHFLYQGCCNARSIYWIENLIKEELSQVP